MNAIYAVNFSVVQNRVMLLLSACGETERRKDDEKDVVVEGYDREKRNRFCRKIRKCSEVIRVWKTRKARIYSSPSSMLAEERSREMFVMHAFARKTRVLPSMFELDKSASKGIVCEKSSKTGRSAKKQSLSIC